MAVKETLVLRGTLEGHNGWVTALATAPENPDLLISASRDKTLLVWKLTRDEQQYGVPVRALHGHSHIVSDVALAADAKHAISSSWDRTLRLWDLRTGKTLRRFVGHKGDVLSVSLSPDNRLIVSGSRDKSIKLWNIQGECKYTVTDKGHTDWVTAVRYSPNPTHPIVVTTGWDKKMKVWNATNFGLQADATGHNGQINAVTIAPDGTLCATGGKDGVCYLWDLQKSAALYSLDAGDEIHALAFSPNRFWLCAATSSAIRIFNLADRAPVDEVRPDAPLSGSGKIPECISLVWSPDGQTLFAGYTDNVIRVWQVMAAI
ncbi:hypothetical protein CANCADRAFT_55704 [Tortispora caseinolytica NRRL Y-17796]|uniref:Small ribosomal subunit protein RACK1 n=1 Tax=Tortispora caseinolytica NRRL Y-17796 TaxID=767744 RepID=A0A1E4TJK5_9ASCO|nr:hypothetical protein CANCADRAFT_55704 [Tortispora caseinolytica NRRL Y-17796]